MATVLTWFVWALFVVSTVILVARSQVDGAWEIHRVITVDGLTVLLWVVVTFFSGIVHSYSRRYMAGSAHETRFFVSVFGFTVIVMGLVAADHVVLFALLWLAMGLSMARLIGINSGWRQAQAAARVARKYFILSSALLGIALTTLWWATGTTTVSGMATAAGTLSGTGWLLAAGALVLAAMVQSALVPFHGWLLASMTAPTPASALMHAGFVNAGGILLIRFAPVITVDPPLMVVIVVVGAASALLGKLLKAVQVDTKTRLGCSTTGQMGFMLMQAGLGFFGASITHLVLHGCYKAYLFLASGGEIEHTSPTERTGGPDRTGWMDIGVTLLAALAGGMLFAHLTGKGTRVDSGVLLTGLVVLTTLHATRSVVRTSGVPTPYRYGAVVLVFLPAIAVYGLVYNTIRWIIADLPVVTVPAELTVVDGVVAGAFLLAYLAIETGAYRYSDRLYVTFVNASQAPRETVLTAREEYREY